MIRWTGLAIRWTGLAPWELIRWIGLTPQECEFPFRGWKLFHFTAYTDM